MAIEFHCSNILAYDADRETYVRCNQSLSAPENQIAKYIVCPACNQPALVPPRTEAATDQLVAAGASAAAVANPTSRTQPHKNQPAPPTQPATDRLTFTGFDPRSRCTRCSGPLNPQYRCLVCGYQSILPSDSRPVTLGEMQLAGCQLWLTKKLTHGIATTNLLMVAHGLVVILTMILGIMAAAVGKGSAPVMLAVLAGLVAAYAYMVIEFRRIARRPPAKLNFWQAAGWNLVLFLYRAGKWRPRRWKTLDLKNRPLGDEQIVAIPDLTSYQVLDLEGTGLTDAGLRRLRGLIGLQRLVVRRTRVTADAVCWLQQRLPTLWIWS